MLTFKLYENTNKILNALSEAKYLNEVLDKMSVQYGNYIEYSVTHPQSIYRLMVYIQDRFIEKEEKKLLENINSRLLYKNIDNIQNILQETNFSDTVTTFQQNEIIHHLEKFANSYENYIKSQKQNIAVPLIINAVSLQTYLNGFIAGLENLTKNYQTIPLNIENHKELSIILSSKMTLSKFIVKLQSLEKTYEEICIIMNISIIEYPIQISKIESGSLWVKIFGHSKVISLLTGFIESSAQFVYRHTTIEGKISAIPKKLESINNILELRNNLKQAGVSTEDIDKHIEKSSILIVKNLNDLLSNESNITINNTNISSIDGNHSQIEQKKPLSIEYNKNENEIEDDK